MTQARYGNNVNVILQLRRQVCSHIFARIFFRLLQNSNDSSEMFQSIRPVINRRELIIYISISARKIDRVIKESAFSLQLTSTIEEYNIN